MIVRHMTHCFLMSCLPLSQIRPYGPLTPSEVPSPLQDWASTTAFLSPEHYAGILWALNMYLLNECVCAHFSLTCLYSSYTYRLVFLKWPMPFSTLYPCGMFLLLPLLFSNCLTLWSSCVRLCHLSFTVFSYCFGRRITMLFCMPTTWVPQSLWLSHDDH